MKIGIFSDWHLGYKWNSQIKMDSFSQLEQAFKQMEEEKVDLIICAGDLFDKTDVTNDELYEAIKLLKSVNIENKINLKANDNLLKIPMISIIGNHEYKGKDYKSTVHLLEILGFLKFLHLKSIKLDTENIEIFGMCGLPDKYALDVLKKWNPIPNPNNYNILLLHQSIKEYLPFEDEMISSISLSNLPKDFNLIINGHLHWSTVKKINDDQTFMLPGSTVFTQSKKLESKTSKGFYILDTITKNIEFKKIKNTRPVYYIDLKIDKEDTNTIEERIKINIEEKIKENENLRTQENNENNEIYKKPIIRLRLKGNLKKGDLIKNIKTNDLENMYKEDVYLTIVNKINEEEFKENINKLKELKKNSKNIEDLIKKTFIEEMKLTNIVNNFDYVRIYDILKNKDYLQKTIELIDNKEI